MRHTLLRTDEISALSRDLRVVIIDHQITAHTGSQVDQHISAAVSDQIYRLLEEVDIPTAFTGLGIAHVQVHNCRTGIRGRNRRVGDLLGCDRYRRVLIHRIPRAGYCTGHNYIGVYCHPSFSFLKSSESE